MDVTESLERRAEEHLRQLSNHIGASQHKCKYELESAQVIEQLLSENRQTSAEIGSGVVYHTHDASGIYANCPACGTAPSWPQQIASLRQDLDRISAEREAYREVLKQIEDMPGGWRLGERHGLSQGMFSAQDIARRILAENDR